MSGEKYFSCPASRCSCYTEKSFGKGSSYQRSYQMDPAHFATTVVGGETQRVSAVHNEQMRIVRGQPSRDQVSIRIQMDGSLTDFGEHARLSYVPGTRWLALETKPTKEGISATITGSNPLCQLCAVSSTHTRVNATVHKRIDKT